MEERAGVSHSGVVKSGLAESGIVTCDVAVIGGGPAGAVVAGQLARAGRQVVLLERTRFPRFHIGESLLPASNAIFRRLGLEERLRAGGFVEKRGASFANEDGEHASYIDFANGPNVTDPLTYQVERSRFDALLLDDAIAAGADVRQERHVHDVVFNEDGVTVTAINTSREHGSNRPKADTTETLRASVVVDASGQAGFLAKQLGLRDIDPDLQNVAIHAQYTGVAALAGARKGDIRIISCRDLSWIWLIPISDTVTSAGFVMPPARRALEPKEQALDRLLASTPLAVEALRGASRVGPVRRDADFSYTAHAYAGTRWLLAGDAGSFIDPVFSTGVMVALESGVEAAEAIDRGLIKGDMSARAFREFDRIQRKRYRFFHRFARGFYDPAFRDLLVQPGNRWGLVDALIDILAGNWRPTWRTRLRAATFFKLAAVHRRYPIVRRLHGPDAEHMVKAHMVKQ